VLALADLGDRSLVNRVRRWLEDPRPRRARAAVRALRGMLGRDATPELLRLLERPSVAPAAADALISLRADVVLREVRLLLQRGWPGAARAARRLSNLLSPQDQLDLLLTCLDWSEAIDGRTREGALAQLDLWLRRTNGRIALHDRERRIGLAARARDVATLPDGLRAELLQRLAP